MIILTISIYLFFTVLYTSFLAAYSLSKVRSLLVKVLWVLSFSICIYLFGYLLELNSTVIKSMIFWNQIQYLTLPFIPGLWLLFSLLYTKKVHSLTPAVLSVIFCIPVLTFFIRITNSHHHLFYSSYASVIQSGHPILYLEKGPWYLIQIFYIFLAFLIVLYVYVKEYYRAPDIKRKQFAIVIIASLLPFLGLLLIVLDVGGLGIDFGALILPISLSLLMLVVFQYDFLSLKALARETVFENSIDALLLIDEKNNLIDYNTMARKVLKSLGYVASKDLHKTLLTILQNQRNEDVRITTEGEVRYYEMKRVELFDGFQHPAGSLIQLGDMTQRKKSEEALRLSEEKYRLLTEKMSDFLWVLDLDTERIRYVSPSVFRFCGYTVEEVLEKKSRELVTPETYRYLKREIPLRIANYKKGVDKDFTDEIEQVCKDGRVIITEVKGRFIYNELTDHLEYMGVSRDITDKKLVQERLVELATIDDLTRLYNRRHFLDLAQKEYHRCQRYGGEFSFLMIDIDFFKAINDTYGHAGGDVVLQDLGQKMISLFRNSDIKGRLGGEEFAVLLVHTTLEIGYSIAEKFRKTIKKSPVIFNGEKIYYTLSIGVTAFNQSLSNFDSLLNLADRGLYEAKRTGRDRSIKKEVKELP